MSESIEGVRKDEAFRQGAIAHELPQRIVDQAKAMGPQPVPDLFSDRRVHVDDDE